MNPRTCIVSRQEKTPDEMIRFVLDGDLNVVPDLKRKLPGRGVWVTAQSDMVATAVEKGGFPRGFKQQAKANSDLPALVAKLLKAEVFSALAFARKAGELVAGRAKVEELMKSGKAALLLHAQGSSSDGRRKLDGLGDRLMEKGQMFEVLESEDYDQITGGVNTMHMAIVEGGLADKISKSIAKLHEYESGKRTER